MFVFSKVHILPDQGHSVNWLKHHIYKKMFHVRLIPSYDRLQEMSCSPSYSWTLMHILKLCATKIKIRLTVRFRRTYAFLTFATASSARWTVQRRSGTSSSPTLTLTKSKSIPNELA